MDRYLYNLMCLKNWCRFTKKEQNQILAYFGSIESINWRRLSQCGLPDNIIEEKSQKTKEICLREYYMLLEKLKMNGIQYIGKRSVLYPNNFHHIDCPPDIFFYKGNERLLENRPKVAIVGTRRPTAYGRKATVDIAKFLSKHGIVVVSGMALGIDAIAHRTALEANGLTMAVMASGVMNAYPKTNTSIFKGILDQNGLVVSEKPFDEAPKPYEFPLRNRLISGFSDAVVVVEASFASGTLTTAQHAINQGKPVFALPGPVFSETSKGTNQLIYDGAYPLICLEDLLAVSGVSPVKADAHKSIELEKFSENAQIIFRLIEEKKKQDYDAIESELNLEYSEILAAVNELVIEGLCRFESLTEIGLA
ncbi:DNA-processing protein DprA [Fusibacter tunisiensis]|uniref:DNA processing protein n=1 Tax=Fusibacter tunisiensis TaxID=1008308 RepID=A0ABS2MME8_9FIRM|nr:DNA-processing protein DprA [Fusibacter tunisiensis]MBM7560574.1 DNA processing protein [Fusibacter tunisiensis]